MEERKRVSERKQAMKRCGQDQLASSARQNHMMSSCMRAEASSFARK